MSRAIAAFLLACALRQVGAVDEDSVDLLQMGKSEYSYYDQDYHDDRRMQEQDYREDRRTGRMMEAHNDRRMQDEYEDYTPGNNPDDYYARQVGLAEQFRGERRAQDTDDRVFGTEEDYEEQREWERSGGQSSGSRVQDTEDDYERQVLKYGQRHGRAEQEAQFVKEDAKRRAKEDAAGATDQKSEKSKHVASVMKTGKAVYAGSTGSAVAKFAEISDMMPEHRVTCPTIDGVPDKPIVFGDISLCEGRISKAQKEGACIVYQFGDLSKMTKNAQTGLGRSFVDNFIALYPGCEVFLFDPSRTVNDTKKIYPNSRVQFRPWSLGNMSLPAIQSELGHSAKRITLLRSDCDGCEWDWIQQAQKEDPSIFFRIDNMAIEFQMVKAPEHSSFMESQEWKDGLPEHSKITSLYSALTHNFKVISGAVEPGTPAKRDQVPESLQKQGVLGHPCCRQISFINSKDVDKPSATLLKTKKSKATAATSTMPQSVANKFLGLRGVCELQEVAVSDDVKFCPSLVREAEERGDCLAFIFGASTKHDIKFIKAFRHNHSTCQLQVFDPKTTFAELAPKLASKLTKPVKDDPNFILKPIGIYAGDGPRVVQYTNGNRGELYTLGEIFGMWDFPAASGTASVKGVPSPRRISLLKGDFASVPRQVWEKQLENPGFVWWGDASIEQLA